jgi:hypothetical protein
MPLAVTQILGDARPGPSGTVLRGTRTSITGSTAPSDDVVPMPAIEVPSVPSNGDLDYGLTQTPLTLPTGPTAFGSMRVRAGGKVIVPGPAVLVVDSLQVDASGELVLDSTNGPIQLYVREYVHLATGSLLTTPDHKPAHASIQIAASKTIDRDKDGIPDPPVRLFATGLVYATIYAPLASVSLPPSFELSGAVAAQRLTFQQGARMHFDAALAVASLENGALPHFAGWRILELPDSPLVVMRYDPLLVLRVSGMTPPLAPDAHYDIGVTPPLNLLSPLQVP